MTKEMKEKVSNRLVLKFGVLLGAALVLLYVRSALSSSIRGITYTILLVLGILCLIGAGVMFFLGKKNGTNHKNYSAIPLGVAIGSVVLYLSNNIIPGYTWKTAVVVLYLLMLVYFIVMAIYTAILLKKPTIKPQDEAELLRKKYAKKKRKKK